MYQENGKAEIGELSIISLAQVALCEFLDWKRHYSKH